MLTRFQKELLFDVADNLRMQQYRVENLLKHVTECEERDAVVKSLSAIVDAKTKLEHVSENRNGQLF